MSGSEVDQKFFGCILVEINKVMNNLIKNVCFSYSIDSYLFTT